MQALEETVMGNPGALYMRNINPVRVGLLLYKLVDDVQKYFNYSQYSTHMIKENIQIQTHKVLEVHSDPEEIVPLFERLDLYGKDTF